MTSATPLSLSSFNPDAKSNVHRHVADYHPCVWKDYFLRYASESMEVEQNIDEPQIESLKNKVRKMLVSKTEKVLAKADFIDSICRLGVSYHFEPEIDELIQHLHDNYVENGEITLEQNISSVAVLFRLLRQQGFHVSPGVFKKFKDDRGNFSERLTMDVEGMLSLYEASHMMVHGEDILEEALTFTSTHLEAIVTQLNPSLAAQVKHCLRQSLHKNIPRLETRSYISIYEKDPNHNEILLMLAKLDFNMLQSLHQKEFGNICKWWIQLDIARKLPYARDRIVENCFWILGVYYEPQYSQARKIMTKIISMLSILDDTYDAYGTIDELELFTKAVERWDISCLEDLPEYMNFFYGELLKVYEETEQEMRKEGRTYALNYSIKELKRVAQAYMTEARWLNNNYTPTTEEYMDVSRVSCCYPMLATTSYIGMGSKATEDIFNWVTNVPKIISSATVICRLMDDIVSSEFEQKREHVSSFLECYMKQYHESKEVAIQECQKRIATAWKDMNEECLRPTEVPMPFLTRILNLSRFMDVIYKDEDNYTNSGGAMKTYIEALFVDPVPI